MGLSLKLTLISTGILSMAMAFKLTLPLLSHFILTQAPSIWAFVLTSFTPPYLYILLNCIILTILASSKLHHQHSPPPYTALLPPEYSAAYGGPHPPVLPSVQIPGGLRTNYDAYDGVFSGAYAYDANVPAKNKTRNGEIANVSNGTILTPSLQGNDSFDFAFLNENEKPPVYASFGHRKAVKASPEGGKMALGVVKPRHETLESPWNTVTEGRVMPLTRHLKKSDTWESQQRRHQPLADQNGGGVGGRGTPPNAKVMKKSETFTERSKTRGKENESPPGSAGRMRKEASLGQDELNRRVEAFIKKFNEEMRLQRQESLRHYQEMINRGAD